MVYVIAHPEYKLITDIIDSRCALYGYICAAREGVPYNVDTVRNSLLSCGFIASIVTFREGNYFMKNNLVIHDELRNSYNAVPKHSVICLGGVIVDALLSDRIFSTNGYIDELYVRNKYVSCVFDETTILTEEGVKNATLNDLRKYGKLYGLEDLEKNEDFKASWF